MTNNHGPPLAPGPRERAQRESDMTSTPAYIGEHNLAKNKYSRPKTLLRNPDAIVIGSGIGGLGVASILAQRKKWRVLVLEGAPTPGGSLRCHEWDGYEFNSGIDSIGDMDPSVGRGTFRPTIDYITGGKLEWSKMPDMHEISAFGEDEYPWYSHPDRNIAWIEERLGEGRAARKYYELTDSGRQALALGTADWRQINTALEHILERGSDS